MKKTKLFRKGRSQAVRLPREFWFDGEEVSIRRHGAAVVLEPLPTDWTWPDELTRPLDADLAQAAAEQPEIAARPEFDRLFPE